MKELPRQVAECPGVVSSIEFTWASPGGRRETNLFTYINCSHRKKGQYFIMSF